MGRHRTDLSEYDDALRTMREAKLSYRKMAANLGIREHAVASELKRMGIEYSEDEMQRKATSKAKREEIVRHINAGEHFSEIAKEFRVSLSTVYNISNREGADKRAKWARYKHICPVCGKETDRYTYCSDECGVKAESIRNRTRRRVRLSSAMVDNDITLEALFKRDGGYCHICGKPCRYDDYTVTEKTVIAGNWYPSIDHVVPLSKGGEHSWSNVALAHRYCNSIKGDKT